VLIPELVAELPVVLVRGAVVLVPELVDMLPVVLVRGAVHSLNSVRLRAAGTTGHVTEGILALTNLAVAGVVTKLTVLTIGLTALAHRQSGKLLSKSNWIWSEL